ncbi:MAG: CRISPR-associated protein Csx18 [Coleofasciculus sp. C2-GNP5-27]
MIYMSRRTARVRNGLVSLFNGGVTLIILLIAPLGLAAVIVNTGLVMGSSYAIASLADGVIRWLHPVSPGELLSESGRGDLFRQPRQGLIRRGIFPRN